MITSIVQEICFFGERMFSDFGRSDGDFSGDMVRSMVII